MATKKKLLQAAAGFGASDPDFNYVTALFDFDGTSGANNNTVSDSSPNQFSMTENGEVNQGSFSPYGDNWSNYFDGSGDYLKTTTNIDDIATSEDFNIEAWIYVTDTSVIRGIFQSGEGNSTLGIRITTAERLQLVQTNGSTLEESASGAIKLNQWHHIAVSRSSGTRRLFLDGVVVDSTTSSTASFPCDKAIVGGRWLSGSLGQPFSGYISNVRFVVGSAIYTSTFTPPSKPVTAVTNTELLTSQSNRFLDNSTNDFDFTVGGDTRVTPFSPFKGGYVRDITTYGGSQHFNLTDSYLTYSGGSSSNATLTISFWIYVTGSMGSNGGLYPRVFCSASNAFLIYLRSDDIRIYNGGEKLQTPIRRYEWQYFVAQLTDSGWQMWLNGESKGTNSSSGNNINLSSTNYIGRDATNAGYFGGYLCDLKVTEGVEYSSANFTPPTAPVSSTVGGPFDLIGASYDSKSFSVASQDSNPQGVRFKSDGTKMYMLGNTNDTVYQYSLSTAWDVSTASYDSVSFSVASQDATPNGIAFSYDGSKMYITGQINDKVFQYDLSTAWDLSTASYANKSLSTQGAGPIEPFMRSNGTDFYYLDNTDDTVYQYTLSTANDISTASYASKSFSVASQETTPTGLAFSSDGTKMFVCGQVGDDINQYTLSTAWDVSTAAFYDVVLDVSSQAVNPSGIDFKTDGNKLYMISNTGDAVYQYSTGSDTCDLLLKFQDAGIADLAGITNVRTVGNAGLGVAPIYGTGSIEFDGSGDYLESNDEMSFQYWIEDGDYTAELWAYGSATGTQVFLAHGTVGSVSTSNWWLETVSGVMKLYISNGSAYTVLSDTVAFSTYEGWVHIAFVNENGTAALYMNGERKDTDTTPTTNTGKSPIWVGGANGSYVFNGYIDDVRITKGVARYTGTSFTPPTEIDLSSDTYADRVILFLNGEGTPNGQNNTFTDSSSNTFTVTPTGNVAQGVASPYGDNWSNYFSGTTVHLSTDGTSVFDMGTSTDFTVELYYSNNYSASLYDTFVSQWPTTASGSWILGLDGSGYPMFMASDYSTSARLLTATTDVTDGDWHHIAVTRSGDVYRLFVDGTQEATVTNSTYNVGRSNTRLYVNAYDAAKSRGADGFQSNHRFVSGTALYTSNFTPPTTALTAVTGTQLLTCNSNSFVDKSSNGFTMTEGGTPKVTRFSPFAGDKPYDITADGGSGTFNQSQYLTVADNATLDVDGAMTAEAWVYINDFPDGNVGATGQGFILTRWVASGSQRSWGMFLGANGQTTFYVSNTGGSSYTTTASAAGALKAFRWHHVAVSWDGSSQRLFIDGDLKATTANASGPFSTASAPFCVNALNTSLTGTNMNMYVADARYFADVAIYTSSFTPPTAPLGVTAGSAYSLNGARYESKSFSILSQETAVEGVEFKTDGTKMYVIGQTSDAVFEYDLSTAWDVSTASYNSVSFSVSSQETLPRSVRFKSDGTRMFVVGPSSDAVYQYDLSTAWDVSSASYNSVSFSVSSQEGTPNGMCFSADGTYMYITGQSGDDINQYSLTTAWDISTASFDSKTLDVSSEETAPEEVAISSDGTQIFILGVTSDAVHQYTLSTPYDVSTGTFTRTFTGLQATNPAGLAFKPDGTKFYVVGPVDDAVKQYSVFSDATVLLSFQDAAIPDLSGMDNIYTGGDAHVSASDPTKYGSNALKLDGTGDMLRQEDPLPALALGTSDFTVEFWMYLTNVTTTQVIFDMRHDSNSNSALTVFVSSGFKFYAGTASITIGTISNDTWHHIAIVRDGSTIRSFIDGVAGGTESNTNDLTCEEFRIGARWDNSAPTTGYLDDFRVTKGVARYTAGFTPPIKALPKR